MKYNPFEKFQSFCSSPLSKHRLKRFIFHFYKKYVSYIFYFYRKHQSKKMINKIIKEKNEIFIELGGGEKRGAKNWINLDKNNECDIYCDLRQGIPFPDSSISMIYSSHFFEHLSYDEGQSLLDECKRVLKLGAQFSICVPNARIYIEGYLKNRNMNNYYRWDESFNKTTGIDSVNYIAYMDGEHKYMFDEENLLHILREKGFKNVSLRKFDKDIDKIDRDFESIYAKGTK